MRRKDREVTDLSQLEEIIGRCDCIHLGLLDGEYPYVVPMNFGYERSGDHFTFYMHAASEGKSWNCSMRIPRRRSAWIPVISW